MTAIDRELISTCVHCGFCLPTCPTWGLWREEMDSPRGRIYLMEGLADGTLRLNPTVVEHFDRCLGCMACVTACPSGVLYDRLIEQTRATIEREYHRPRRERALRSAVLAVVPHPRRLRTALRLAPAGRRVPLPGLLRPLTDLAPPWRSGAKAPELTQPVGERAAGRVGLLTGCVQRVLFGDVNAATARVLAAYGFEVAAPRAQGCCGALAVHAGRRDQGLDHARRTIDAFEQADVDLVASNAAGCGSNLKDYAHLLADDPVYAERAAAFSARARDVSELLAGLEPRAELKPLELRVALQDSCHLAHAQGVRTEQRAVLAGIPGLSVVEPGDQALCCGSAGIYNLVQPEAALELGRRKAERVLAVDPDAYAAANPGCIVQVTAALRRARHPLPAFHPVELIDASLRGADAGELLAQARR
ncbi:MAG: (Fe-S)-binding protein [Gaiellaceae bacterium]